MTETAGFSPLAAARMEDASSAPPGAADRPAASTCSRRSSSTRRRARSRCSARAGIDAARGDRRGSTAGPAVHRGVRRSNLLNGGGAAPIARPGCETGAIGDDAPVRACHHVPVRTSDSSVSGRGRGVGLGLALALRARLRRFRCRGQAADRGGSRPAARGVAAGGRAPRW